MQLFVYFIGWCVSIVRINSEWVEIPQKIGSKSAQVIDLKPSTVHETLPSSSPLRYEDLEHIIGPGFEDDLERFYKEHKKETVSRTTTAKPVAHRIFLPPINDPWSIYDKPHTSNVTVVSHKLDISNIEENSQIEHKMHVNETTHVDDHNSTIAQRERNANKLNASVVMDHTIKTKTTTKHMEFNNKVKPKIVRYASVNQRPLSFAAFLKFIKSIQSTFVTTTARSIQDKIKMLEGFKNSLLVNIESRIQSLWPVTPVVRSKRSHHTESHGGSMDFPSAEGALMTISFLTFAVFLIKLVLQVINTIKSKHYSYNSFDTVATGAQPIQAVSVIKRNRNARRLSFTGENDFVSQMNGILHAMHNLKN